MSNSKSKVQGRIPDGLASRFDEFREARNLNQTEALKRLLREGLEARNRKTALVSQYLVTAGAVASVLATWSVFSSSRALLSLSLFAFAVVASLAAYWVHHR